MAKKVRAARHYQHPDAPIRRIALLGARNARASLTQALKALPGMLDMAKTRELIRHGRARDVAHTAIDWHHFQQILRHPFERLARAYEAGAKLGERKINGAFAAKRRKVRFGKGGPEASRGDDHQGREETPTGATLQENLGAEADVAEALRCLNRESSVAKWSDHISKERINEIAAIADEDIDTSEIPEATGDFFERAGGKFDKTTVDYSPGKPHAHCGLCLHFRRDYEKAFDSDQPRDEHGQWTSGGAMLTSTGVPMSQYTHQSLREDFREQSGERDPEEVVVPISNIRATQATVGPNEGRSEGAPVPGMRDEHGNVHIINGHHRVHAAIQRGDTTIRARVYNIRSAVRKEASGLCELVEGEIDPQMWCDLFVERTK